MNKAVIPAKAGIQDHPVILSGAKNLGEVKRGVDSGLRQNDILDSYDGTLAETRLTFYLYIQGL
jgi:hypothetical protein